MLMSIEVEMRYDDVGPDTIEMVQISLEGSGRDGTEGGYRG